MKLRAHKPTIARLEKFQWINLYLLLFVASCVQSISLIQQNEGSFLFPWIIFSGVSFSLAFLIVWSGQARYGIYFFASQARGLWPSRFTACVLGLLSLCVIPLVELNQDQVGSTTSVIMFSIFAFLALVAAWFDHQQLTKS